MSNIKDRSGSSSNPSITVDDHPNIDMITTKKNDNRKNNNYESNHGEGRLFDDEESPLSAKDMIANEIKALGPHIHSPVPNPAPVGLFAFGLTTALLQMKHTNLAGDSTQDAIEVGNLVWGYGLFYGGLLQLIAGLHEVKRNNIFGYTAFLSYGGFWMSLSTAEILNHFYPRDAGINAKAVQAMLGIMGVFTFVLWICTFNQNMTISVLFFSLMSTFVLLCVGVDYDVIDVVAGWVGIFTSAVAFWLGSVELINDILGGGNELIPLGHFDRNKFKFAGFFHVPGRIHGVTHRTVLYDSRYGPDDQRTPTLSMRRQSAIAVANNLRRSRERVDFVGSEHSHYKNSEV